MLHVKGTCCPRENITNNRNRAKFTDGINLNLNTYDLTVLSVCVRVVRRPRPWQKRRMEVATLAGASASTSPTSSTRRMLVLVLSAAWYIVSVVCRNGD